jgi:hypothetical protein
MISRKGLRDTEQRQGWKLSVDVSSAQVQPDLGGPWRKFPTLGLNIRGRLLSLANASYLDYPWLCLPNPPSRGGISGQGRDL